MGVGASHLSVLIITFNYQLLFAFQIDSVYTISGVGRVVGGTLVRGTIREGDNLLLGPLDDGEFKSVTVGTIHRNRLPCRFVTAGQAPCISFTHQPHVHIRNVSENK